MGESDAEWGELAAFDRDMAAAWDKTVPLPDSDAALDAFVESRHITVGDLVRVGARAWPGDDLTLVFSGARGIKFRRVRDGKRWNFQGSEFPDMRIVSARDANDEGPRTLLVAEGETDGARLSGLYPACDVGIMQAGAKAVTPAMVEQAAAYDRVCICLDNDDAGRDGLTKWVGASRHAVAFPPPVGGDWCEYDGDAVELPDAPEVLPIIVPAGDLMEIKAPEQQAWFESAVLPVGGLGLLHGWIKSYKSFIAFDMLSSIAQGTAWAGFESTEEPAKALVVQYEIVWPFYRERVAAMQRRAPHREEFDTNYLTWDPLSRPRLTAGDKAREDEFLREVDAAGVQVVLIDPVRRFVRGVAKHDREFEQEARVALAFVERLQMLGITVILTHHDTKGDSRLGGGNPLGITGAGAWGGDPDTIVSIALPEGDEYMTSKRRNLWFTSRNGPAPSPRGMKIEGEGAEVSLVYTEHPYAAEVEEEEADGQPSI